MPHQNNQRYAFFFSYNTKLKVQKGVLLYRSSVMGKSALLPLQFFDSLQLLFLWVEVAKK
jgi:hypothetical protein